MLSVQLSVGLLSVLTHERLWLQTHAYIASAAFLKSREWCLHCAQARQRHSRWRPRMAAMRRTALWRKHCASGAVQPEQAGAKGSVDVLRR